MHLGQTAVSVTAIFQQLRHGWRLPKLEPDPFAVRSISNLPRGGRGFGLPMQASCNNEGLPEFTKGWTDSETTQFRSLTFQIVTESTLPSVLLTRPGNTQKCIGSGLQLILRVDSQVFRGTSGSYINPRKFLARRHSERLPCSESLRSCCCWCGF